MRVVFVLRSTEVFPAFLWFVLPCFIAIHHSPGWEFSLSLGYFFCKIFSLHLCASFCCGNNFAQIFSAQVFSAQIFYTLFTIAYYPPVLSRAWQQVVIYLCQVCCPSWLTCVPTLHYFFPFDQDWMPVVIYLDLGGALVLSVIQYCYVFAISACHDEATLVGVVQQLRKVVLSAFQDGALSFQCNTQPKSSAVFPSQLDFSQVNWILCRSPDLSCICGKYVSAVHCLDHKLLLFAS